MKRKRKVSKLMAKALVSVLVLAVAMCAVSALIGYREYHAYIQKQYNDRAYEVAAVFRDYFTEDELAYYLKLAKGYHEGTVPEETIIKIRDSEDYQSMTERLMLLREDVGANDIYMVYMAPEELEAYDGDAEDWTPFTYVFDSYTVPELTYLFGDTSGINPDYVKECIQIYETGERMENYFLSHSDYGYNTSAILPIVRDGETIGVIGVEVPMKTIGSATRSFMLSLLLALVGMLIFVQILYAIYLNRTTISPINLIAKEAGSFVDNENQISEKLKSVHTHDEIEGLADALYQLEEDVNRYIADLTHATAEKERIRTELSVATQIQQDMLPKTFPAFPERHEFDLFASNSTAKEVGGDFYDFFFVDDDHLALVFADVSDKGIPAALFMVVTRTLIKNEAQLGRMPAQLMASVNNQLCENNDAQMFVTAWVGVLTLSTGTLVAVNAGHEHPMYKPAGGTFSMINDPHGMVLAAMEDMPYSEYRMQLSPGDSLFIYTDGAPDAARLDGAQFSREEMIKVLNEDPEGKPKELVQRVGSAIEEFTKGADQFDDITLLCITYHGPAHPDKTK